MANSQEVLFLNRIYGAGYRLFDEDENLIHHDIKDGYRWFILGSDADGTLKGFVISASLRFENGRLISRFGFGFADEEQGETKVRDYFAASFEVDPDEDRRKPRRRYTINEDAFDKGVNVGSVCIGHPELKIIGEEEEVFVGMRDENGLPHGLVLTCIEELFPYYLEDIAFYEHGKKVTFDHPLCKVLLPALLASTNGQGRVEEGKLDPYECYLMHLPMGEERCPLLHASKEGFGNEGRIALILGIGEYDLGDGLIARVSEAHENQISFYVGEEYITLRRGDTEHCGDIYYSFPAETPWSSEAFIDFYPSDLKLLKIEMTDLHCPMAGAQIKESLASLKHTVTDRHSMEDWQFACCETCRDYRLLGNTISVNSYPLQARLAEHFTGEQLFYEEHGTYYGYSYDNEIYLETKIRDTLSKKAAEGHPFALIALILFGSVFRHHSFYGGKTETYKAPDYEANEVYFRKLESLDEDDMFTPYFVGVCYREGCCVEKDPDMAKRYILRAAMMGNVIAQQELGMDVSSIRFEPFTLPKGE